MNIKIVKKLLFLSVLFAYQAGLSQWNSDPSLNNAICLEPGGQYAPNITSDEKGGAIIVWEDYSNGIAKIYAQRIDKNGNIKWNNNGIQICDINSAQSNPKIIDDGYGGALIVWVDDRNGNYDLYAQRIDSLGNRLWDSNGIVVFENDGNQTLPQIVKTNNNIFYAVCIDDRMGVPNLFVQKIDLQGNMTWGDNGKMGNHLRSLRNFKSILDENDNLVLVWEDFSFNCDGMIFAQKLDSDGNFLWEFNQDDLRISSLDLNIKAQHPDIIQLQTGNYLIAWQDNRSGDFDIYGQIILINGVSLLSNDGEILEGSAGDDITPELCTSADKYYLIAWINNTSSDEYLKVRSFYSDPVTFIQYWSQSLYIAQQYNGWFNNLNLTPDKAGGALLSFVSSDAEYSDIRFAKISSYGDKRIGVLCSADINQTQLSVCSDSSDGIIAVWADIRSGDFDIYCSQVDANGVFGAGQHETGLVADYRFNGEASDEAYQNNATIHNAALTSDRFGNPNSAFEFNGINSYITAPSSTLLESPTYELTQCAWVNIYNWGLSGNSFVPVIMKSDQTENLFQYRLGISNTEIITSTNEWNNSVYQSGFQMDLNQWYFISSVIKEDTVTTYINGELIGQNRLTSYPIINDNKPLEFGRDVPGSTEYFYGKIDDIKIYNRSLSSSEILNLYNAGSTTSVINNNQNLPKAFNLEQNYPNPFNPSTKIKYTIPNVSLSGVEGSRVQLKVYDVLGNEVATLVNDYKPAGIYEVTFDASKLSSGIYFYKLQSGNFVETKKMVLLR
jgi:hypothetical protein